MSKECLNIRDARTKLGFTGSSPGASDEIVTKAQCLAMKAKSEPLSKYTTNYECPADDDIIKGSKIKYTLFPNSTSIGIEWNNGESGWYVEENGNSGRCWKCKNDTANIEPGFFYFTGKEGIQYKCISTKMAFIFRVNIKSTSGTVGIFTLPDIDDWALVAGYADTNGNYANLTIDYRYWTSVVYDTEERAYHSISQDLWLGIVCCSNGDILLYTDSYAKSSADAGSADADEFIGYMEKEFAKGNKPVIITAAEQSNSGGGEGSNLGYINLGKPYFNSGMGEHTEIEESIPQWFDITQKNLEVYEGHLAVELDV